MRLKTLSYNSHSCWRASTACRAPAILVWTHQVVFLTKRGWPAVPSLISWQKMVCFLFQALYSNAPSKVKPPKGFLAFQEMPNPVVQPANTTDPVNIITKWWQEKGNLERLLSYSLGKTAWVGHRIFSSMAKSFPSPSAAFVCLLVYRNSIGVSLCETHDIPEEYGTIRFLLLSQEVGQQRAARDIDKITTLNI